MNSNPYPKVPFPPSARQGLPARHRADEFYMSIRYQPSVHGGRANSALVPGLYVEASFSNEGEAFTAIERSLLSSQTVQNVFTTLAQDKNVPDVFMNLAGALNDAVLDAQGKRHAAMIQSLRRQREALAVTEAALREAGIEPEAV